MSTPSAGASPRPAWGNVLLCSLLGLLLLGLMVLHMREGKWHAPGASRWLAAGIVLLSWITFTAWLGWHRRKASRQQSALAVSERSPSGDTLIVAYASQTGTAEQWARQTAQNLQQAGVPVRLLELGQLDARALGDARRVLFVVSTTGEGDAPDHAARFVTQCMRAPLALASLQYGLLALGDSDYDDFCGFGRALRHWLQQSGATPLFDAVEVDSGDPAALRHWQHHLALLSGASELPDWQAPVYQRWQLIERVLLNPGSVGGPCFHLALRPLDGETSWQAGDLVEVGPRHAGAEVDRWLAVHGYDGDAVVERAGHRASLRDWLVASHLPERGAEQVTSPESLVASLQALPHREYSIASVPSDGALHLLVRRMQREDGSPGIGSGWLTMHADVGGEIALRIRSNPAFHAPDDERPLLLIGNGTGLAGLRALLKARIEAGRYRNWLLFGERESTSDFYHGDEILRWQRSGLIERLDLVWSREGDAREYVQDRLRTHHHVLSQWVEQGAAIYVCGSLAGMAPGVDAVLRETLGAETVERLREEGRYRRDVY
ncbi:sulfite reductase (NADPH) flavoprotein alpha-component [Dyella jiangningensis]|uniref:sulfite reductase subunit alpha n=1 Tax=Dyella sp. AtDHG13 TaxID=1938897 RepID=UPI000889E700|nr:sulfite reductase flavoprotein subunit alpha [Dyella sp. AtDHG13]PXV58325.1 sulfite reductase (NADPH) flavoprotein alpha-component [Dyella sp. AtDHG13]SDK07101.1 sulfite reductase (NADPH) flavoprotein alpha-component [Dyella jiangningensis]